jgi:hypothetical protein
LKRAGVRLIVVDGAYDRRMAASPWVTDSVILVVGASLGANMDALLSKTAEWMTLFSLPACREEERAPLASLLASRGVYGKRAGKWEPLSMPSFAELPQLPSDFKKKEVEALAIAGALTDRVLRKLLQVEICPHLVVPDWTHIFAAPVLLRRYVERGGKIETLRPVHLRGVAVNPVSPEGHAFPPQELKERVAELCGQVPVYDVWRDSLEEGGDHDRLG